MRMNEPITIADFLHICRICLNEHDKMTSLDTSEVIEMLKACTSIDVFETKIRPHQICATCLSLLKTSYKFYRKLEYANQFLTDLIKEHHNDQIEEKCRYKYSISDDSFNDVEVLPKQIEEEGVCKESNPDLRTTVVGNCSSLTAEEDINIVSDTEEILSSEANIKETLRKYSCSKCKRVLCSRFTMLRHMETHNAERFFKHRCPICGKGFFDKGNVLKHVDRHKGNAKHNCRQCKRKFYELSALAAHAKQKHRAKPKQCSKCPQQFYHPLQLELHERNHAPKTLSCEICGKLFQQPFKLRAHAVVHSTARPFHCTECDKSFKTKEIRHRHIVLYHCGPIPREVCTICGKLIIQKNMKLHLQTHTRDVLYKCSECPKQYTTKTNLHTHIKEKHRNEIKACKHLCNVCGKAFHYNKHLKVHMMLHTGERPFKCEICSKQYRSRDTLTAHVRTVHKDERPYACAICGKAFHTSTILKCHMRTHTGEKPFGCTICGKAFGSRSVVRTHMRVHS